ncbi:MAG: hypothetical protein J6X84_01440 [Treponema sp.]|nr:hypothetical protein [Treponema sp.]
MDSNIVLFIIKLISGGIVAFLSILLMSKIRTAAWAFMVAGFLLSYAALIYNLLIELGVLTQTNFAINGVPISSLIWAIIPSLCFFIALILMLLKK